MGAGMQGNVPGQGAASGAFAPAGVQEWGAARRGIGAPPRYVGRVLRVIAIWAGPTVTGGPMRGFHVRADLDARIVYPGHGILKVARAWRVEADPWAGV